MWPFNKIKEFFKQWLLRQRQEEILHFFTEAVIWAEGKELTISRIHGEHCLQLFKKVPTNTIGDCSWGVIKKDGVLIPELMHEGTVKQRLAALGVNL